MLDRRQAVSAKPFPDDRRTGEDRRRSDPGNRLIIAINSASEGGKGTDDPFPETATPLFDITPFIPFIVLALIGVVIWLAYSCG